VPTILHFELRNEWWRHEAARGRRPGFGGAVHRRVHDGSRSGESERGLQALRFLLRDNALAFYGV